MLDIKEKIEEIVEKVKGDPKLMEEFKKDPIKAVEKVTGLDLPDEAVEKVVAGVKAKLSGDKLGGIGDLLKKFS